MNKLATVFSIIVAAVLAAPLGARAQTPVGCDANLFDQAIQRDKPAARPGEIVTYNVAFVNRSTLGSPPNVQTGCNVLNVTANFVCPGPTGAPNGPSTNLVTDVDIPANDVVTTFGPFQCVMPDIDPGTAFAGVFGTGDLDDGGPSPFLINKTISTVVQTCLVKVDKQVSCDGGATWVDPGLVFANEDGTHGCSAPDGTPILVRYNVGNVGQTDLFSCSILDSNPAINTVVLPALIAHGTATGFILASNPPACSAAFEANEPNTATVNCFCKANLDPNDKVSAFDVANVSCQSLPELRISKQCTAGATALDPDRVDIEVVASSADLSFENCALVDNLFLTDPTCPGLGPETFLFGPAPFSLAAGQTIAFHPTLAAPLAAPACNTVSITCQIAGTQLTRTASASAVCPAQVTGCLTRTPGFWGTHPDITRRFLPLEVCGVTIDNVAAGNGHSAIEAMCSVGTDKKLLPDNIVQLVRQCTAAELNIAASIRGGGSCENDNPNLAALIEHCCSDDSVCTGASPTGFTTGSCIAALDAFNNSIDTLDFGVFRRPGPADPSACQGSKGNGVVVTP